MRVSPRFDIGEDFMIPKTLPKTLALIPDGNRRWARKHRSSIMNGYSSGVKKFIEFSEWCADYGINSVTVWAFSTENFKRSMKEREILFSIYKRAAKDKDIIKRLHANNTRLKIVGNKSLLPKDLKMALHKIEDETKCYKDRIINVMISYGGRDDILHAIKGLAADIKTKSVKINEEVLRRYLISNTIPDVDFIIRTSGEHRLSGFIPWQSVYSELYFSNKLWPDFTKKDLHYALMDYNARQRRFGK